MTCREWRVWGEAVPETPILQTEDLTKEFAGFVAVRSVNLQVVARQHSCADRTQRRRQNHLLQSPDQVPDADARPHRVRRPRYHRAEAGRRGAARAGALVPDFGGVSASDGAGECAHRAAAPARQFVRFLALEARARASRRPGQCADRRCRAFGLRRGAGGRAALWPQARAGNRHDAGARSRDVAARRADGRHGTRRHRPHQRADQSGRRQAHRADGRAQSQSSSPIFATASPC